jgi:hypothetical protein
MTTIATAEMKQFAADWKAVYKSAKISGIVGDTAHAKRGGFHISREDQTSKTNYSIVRPDDRLGPDNTASAVDMNLSPADMITCTRRLIAAFENVNDPRRKYINAFNGTTDGKVARRWDVYARTVGSASADHLWHVHLSIRRRYCNSVTAMKAILSILKGESVAAYLASIGVGTPQKTSTTTVPKPPVKPAPVAPVKAPAYPGRELRRNDKQKSADPAVKAFQAQMIRRGWTSLGTADGFFGAKTDSVVRRWQKNCKMQVDGVIGPKTWPTPWTRKLGA